MSWRVSTLFAAGALAGCMASGPPAPAQTPPAPPAPPAAGASSAPGGAVLLGTPLLLDRTDLRLGTTVQLAHVPSVSELHDLQTFYTCEIPFHGRAHSGVRGEHCLPARPRFEPDQGFAGNVFLPMAELDASEMPAFTCAACSLTEWEGRCEEQCQKYEQEKEG